MSAEQLAIIGDFGKDLDDENALLYAIGAQHSGEVTLSAVVANLEPAEDRARLARGTLDTLGTFTIPVGVGTSCNVQANTEDYETGVPYASRKIPSESGTELLGRTLDSSIDGSLTLVLNSGMTDAGLLLEAVPRRLIKDKVAQVAIMGGVETTNDEVVLNTRGRMIPDSSANNEFDRPAAEFVYDWLQAENITMSVLTREAAYGCKFDLEFSEQLASTGNPVGVAIRDRQIPAMTELWKIANSPAGSEERGTLPDRCDRDWFIKTYLNNTDPGEVEDIWPIASEVGQFQLYDVLNIAAVVRPVLFEPKTVRVGRTSHSIIGISSEQNGIRDANRLRTHVKDRELLALAAA